MSGMIDDKCDRYGHLSTHNKRVLLAQFTASSLRGAVGNFDEPEKYAISTAVKALELYEKAIKQL